MNIGFFFFRVYKLNMKCLNLPLKFKQKLKVPLPHSVIDVQFYMFPGLLDGCFAYFTYFIHFKGCFMSQLPLRVVTLSVKIASRGAWTTTSAVRSASSRYKR